MAEVRFDDRVAVVTGAGGGLGREYALLLANRGAKLVINDLGGAFDGTGSGHTAAEKMCQEIKDLGGEAVPNFDSVADWEGASNIIKTAIDAFGKVDILINNAGILRDKSFIKMDMEDYEKVMGVHLNGTFFCSKAAFPHMRENNYGRIISASSGAGVYGNFGQANYGAAKMGIVGLMHVLKQEGAKYNIMANVIVPVAGTRMTATVFPADLLDVLKPEFVAPIVCLGMLRELHRLRVHLRGRRRLFQPHRLHGGSGGVLRRQAAHHPGDDRREHRQDHHPGGGRGHRQRHRARRRSSWAR